MDPHCYAHFINKLNSRSNLETERTFKLYSKALVNFTIQINLDLTITMNLWLNGTPELKDSLVVFNSRLNFDAELAFGP